MEDTFAREISPVLTPWRRPRGTVARRHGLLAEGTLSAASLAPVLSLVLCGYLAGLAYEASRPAVPAQSQQLASWLEAHHFRLAARRERIGHEVSLDEFRGRRHERSRSVR